MIDVKNMTRREMEAFISEMNEKPYRAKQMFTWLYKKHVDSVDKMTDMAKDFRQRLSEKILISRLEPENIHRSADGSKKYIFTAADGYSIECVVIVEKNHLTLCLSTQIGCALNCRFCCTGSRGLIRNLSVSEIVNQVAAVLRHEQPMDKLPNLVFMGMGEPLANYENTRKSISILMDPFGFGFSHRKITVSTSGIIPLMKPLASETNVNIAVSLNASNNKTRSYLMPVNKKYPLKDLIETAKTCRISPRKRITFEYILIRGVNDSVKNAIELTGLLKGIACKINLIPFNEHPFCEFKTPEEDAVTAFQDVLKKNNLTAPIRRSKGSDIYAACGQLGGIQHRDKTGGRIQDDTHRQRPLH